MVSSTSIFFMVITVLISFLLPLGLVVYFYKKERISLIAVLVGAFTFFVFQMVTRIPLLNYLSGLEWYKNLAANLVFISLFLSLTAGLFEEVGRYIGFRYLLRNKLEWKNGIAFGIGHGGIEAILLAGFTYINNIVYSFMINSGTFDSFIGQYVGSEMAQVIKKQLTEMPPYLFAAAGVERIFAVVVHITLSLIVLYAVMSKKVIYLAYAILLHTLVNLPAVIIPNAGLSIWYSELYLLIVAIVGLIFIRRSKAFFETCVYRKGGIPLNVRE